MVAAISAGSSSIELGHFVRARDWLLGAEATMPDIFREMVGKSDVQVLDELHYYCWQIWIKDKKPVHQSRLIHFLQSRVPSDKIMRLIEVAVKANILDQIGGTDTYRPRPKDQHGME